MTAGAGAPSGACARRRSGRKIGMAEKAKQDPRDLDGSVTHLLHRASQLADDAVKSELEKLKVTPRQFALLTAIEAHSGSTQVELVAISGIDRSTMTDMTRRLVVRGLIEKGIGDGDRRTASLTLSSSGKRLLKQCRSAVQTAEAEFLARLSPTRRKSLLTTLGQVVAGPKGAARAKRQVRSTDSEGRPADRG